MQDFVNVFGDGKRGLSQPLQCHWYILWYERFQMIHYREFFENVWFVTFFRNYGIVVSPGNSLIKGRTSEKTRPLDPITGYKKKKGSWTLTICPCVNPMWWQHVIDRWCGTMAMCGNRSIGQEREERARGWGEGDLPGSASGWSANYIVQLLKKECFFLFFI